METLYIYAEAVFKACMVLCYVAFVGLAIAVSLGLIKRKKL
jgi:hypothetical protein